jgi:hypothetical protein
MNFKTFFISLVVVGVVFSLAYANGSNDELKGQFDQALSVLQGKMTPAAKAKVGGDLKWTLGNIRKAQVDPNELEIVPLDANEAQRQMKEQMDRLGIKFKVPKPEVREKLLRMINQAEKNLAVKSFQ